MLNRRWEWGFFLIISWEGLRVYGPRRGRISTEIILPHSYNPINNRDNHTGGREPSDAMSLYADTSLPDLLGRPSLHYADRASAMQWTSLHHAEQLFKNLGYNVKNVIFFFWHSGIRILLKIRFIYWLSWLETYMDT